ncbi:hypothetical protein [Streptomyces sp. SLBN-8D4]|uniref:hypothetical protein n=1 Tax=Streptomyces sp. SLBN-8D4 TaxID=3377728 RepID=UPI003C79A30E
MARADPGRKRGAATCIRPTTILTLLATPCTAVPGVAPPGTGVSAVEASDCAYRARLTAPVACRTAPPEQPGQPLAPASTP